MVGKVQKPYLSPLNHEVSSDVTERVRKASSSASTRPLKDAELFDTQSDALNASCTGALTAPGLISCKTLSAPAAVSGPCAASTVWHCRPASASRVGIPERWIHHRSP